MQCWRCTNVIQMFCVCWADAFLTIIIRCIKQIWTACTALHTTTIHDACQILHIIYQQLKTYKNSNWIMDNYFSSIWIMLVTSVLASWFKITLHMTNLRMSRFNPPIIDTIVWKSKLDAKKKRRHEVGLYNMIVIIHSAVTTVILRANTGFESATGGTL